MLSPSSPLHSAADEAELHELAAELVTASRALMAIAVRSIETAPVELTLTQHRVLVVLTNHGDQTMGSLARHLGVNPSNATRVCDRLQRLRLVTRQPSPHDGRAVTIAVTADGARVVDAVSARRSEEVIKILRARPPAQARTAIAALAAFNDAAHERRADLAATWLG